MASGPEWSSPGAQTGGAQPQVRRDDIELPSRSPSGGADPQTPVQPVSLGMGGKALVATGALAAAVALGIWFAPTGLPKETDHPHWKLVKQATEASKQAGESQVAVADATGAVAFLSQVSLGEQQRDVSTSEAVRQALRDRKSQAAVEAIQKAQQIPEVTLADQTSAPRRVSPTLSEGLKEDILSGDASFFHLYIYDCCAEDGDVVEVELNGAVFATVPLTHVGATLSIPLVSDKLASLTLRALHDGGGGVTIGLRTSEGEAAVGVIAEGDYVSLGLIGK